MIISTTSDVINAKTADLVAFYNEHATTPVTKFADRKTAERRVIALLKQLAEVDKLNRAPEPKLAARQVAAPLVKSAGAPKAEVREKLSEAQVKSWSDPSVREARSERSAVTVDGVEYPSVPQAFRELEIPMWKMPKFRGQLKEAGQLFEFGHKWVIIPLNY